MAGSIVGVDDRSSLIEAINRIKYRDAGNSRFPAQVIWGNTGTTYPLILVGTTTNHLAALLGATSSGATPSTANAVVLIQDLGLTIGAGKQLRLTKTDGTDPLNWVHSGTTGIVFLNASEWIVGALGVGVTPGALGAGEILAAGNINWKSGTANVMTFDHAATGARVVTFQDLTGTVALLGVANGAGNLTLAGHLLFSPDTTYDIGASGATRPRDLYLARNAVIGGDLTVTGAFINTTKKARVTNSANISVANNTFQSLTFNFERWDNDAIHDTSSNTSRLTCKTAGLYDIDGQILYAVSGAGNRGIRVLLNGATSIAEDFRTNTGAGLGTRVTISTQYELAVNDYVELQAFQDSGGALDVLTAANHSPEFMMARIG